MTVIATAGHVDHGKSSLVLALTGTDPDRFAEEQRRGLTIDLGFAHTELPSGAAVSFVDVPGHVRFLRNMLAGVGGVDACLFVVAATEGWKPQSEEHLRILEILGFRRGVVALTKVDLVDDEWAELARLEVADHLAGTFLADAPVVGLAAPSGRGVDELRDELDRLVASLADGGPDDHPARPRLWIDRSFAATGSGTVVTGTLTGGHVAVDDRLTVLPRDREVRVRAIQTAGRTVDRLQAGNRVALNLGGVAHDEVERGDVLVTPGRWWTTDRFDARLDVLAALDHEVSRRGAYVAYVGSREVPVRVRVLGTDALAPGTSGAVRVFAPVSLPLVPGDRFVLRESGRDETVGGGEILDVDPALPASRARPDRSVDRVVAERGWVDADRLALLTGTTIEPTVGRWVVDPAALTAAVERVRVAVDDAGELGADLAGFDERDRAVLAEVLAAAGEVVIDGGTVRRADAVDPFADHPFVTTVRDGGFSPPAADGIDRAEVRELVRRGHLVERDGIAFHPDAIDAAARAAAELLVVEPDGFTMSAFRERLGVSRKFALPLAAELDARGVTRRRGDVRIGGPRLPPASAGG